MGYGMLPRKVVVTVISAGLTSQRATVEGILLVQMQKLNILSLRVVAEVVEGQLVVQMVVEHLLLHPSHIHFHSLENLLTLT